MESEFRLLPRQEIEIELAAGTGVYNFGQIARDIVGVAAEPLGKGEG